jgi:hypothetical protein
MIRGVAAHLLGRIEHAGRNKRKRIAPSLTSMAQ